MVDRYQQGQLASSVVGTPGVDRSAGVVEQQIAQNAQQMSNDTAAGAMQDLQSAQQNFNQARQTFAHQKLVNQHIQNQQRQLNAQMNRLDEDDAMSATVKTLQDMNQDNPRNAVVEFEKLVPSMRQNFQQKYGSDPQLLRMMLPSQRASERQALAHLTSWSSQTETANINRKLSVMPQQMTDFVAGLDGTPDQQLFAFQKKLGGTNDVYVSLRESAVDSATKDLIEGKRLQFSRDAVNQLIDHISAQTPRGEEGMRHIEGVRDIVRSAHMFGLPMNPKDQKDQLEHLDGMYSSRENSVIVGIQGESSLKSLDANRLKADLLNAAEDPEALTQVTRQVQVRLEDLDKQIALVAKEPESRIRNARLIGLKQQQSAFITELGIGLKEKLGYEQLQRTLTTFVQSQIRFNERNAMRDRMDLIFQQGQLRFFQGQEDRALREQTVKESATFNGDWAKIEQKMFGALGQPQGQKQQEAMHGVAAEAIPVLNKALARGMITPSEYHTRVDNLSRSLEKLSPVSTGKNWLGQEKTSVLKGDAKARAIRDSQQQFGQMMDRERGKFFQLQGAQEQLNSLTKDKSERVRLTSYMATHMPGLLDSPGFQKLSGDQQSAKIAALVKSMVTQHRNGTLK